MPRRRKKRKRRRKKWRKSRCASNAAARRKSEWAYQGTSECTLLSCTPPWQLCRFCDEELAPDGRGKTWMIHRALLLYLMGKHKEARQEAVLLKLQKEQDEVDDEIPF